MTSARDGIVANVRWLAGANLFVKPVWFAFLLLSTRFLGPEEFGKFMFALSYVGILTYVLEGGIDVFALREISARPESLWQVFPNTLLLKCVSGVAVGVVALLSTIFTGVSREAQILIAIAVLHGILNNLLVHGRFVFRALEIMRFEAYSIVVEKGAIVLICGIALFVYPTAAVFLAAFVIAYALATSATFLMLRRQTRFSLAWTPWPTLWKAVLKPALPFALMGIFMVVYFRAGTLMLQWLTGSEANIGYFNAGYRLVEAFALLPTIMVMPLYATFTRERSDKVIVGQRVHQSARGLLAVSLFVAVPFVFFSRDMTLLLYGPAYLPASQAIGVTVLTIVPVGMTWLFVHLAGAVGRQRILNYFIVGITLLNLTLNFILIRQFGVMGAAQATLVTETMMAMSAMWVVRDYIDAARFIGLGVGALMPVAALWIMNMLHAFPSSFPLQVLSVLSVLTIGFFLAGVLRIDEIRKLARR